MKKQIIKNKELFSLATSLVLLASTTSVAIAQEKLDNSSFSTTETEEKTEKPENETVTQEPEKESTEATEATEATEQSTEETVKKSEPEEKSVAEPKSI